MESCTTGNVDMGSSRPTNYTCVTTDSKNITASAK